MKAIVDEARANGPKIRGTFKEVPKLPKEETGESKLGHSLHKDFYTDVSGYPGWDLDVAAAR